LLHNVRTGLLVGLGAVLITVAGVTGPTLAPPPVAAAQTAPILTSVDWQLFDLTNQARAQAGLPPLAMVQGLAANATSWSQTMAGQGSVSHCACWMSQISSVDPNWTALAQNVGQAYGPGGLQQQWMQSPAHRDNVLGPYRYVGIGSAFDDSGRLWATVDFLDASDSPPTVPAPPPGLPTSQARAFITAAFHDYLGATPNATDLATPISSDGNVRMQYLLPFAHSAPWIGPKIDGLYHDALGRTPDSAGRAYWIGQVANGLPFVTIAGFVYGSQEYWNSHGATASSWVQAVYHGILHRDPDAAGEQYYVDQIAAGTPIDLLARTVYQSAENRTARVAALYPVLLGRTADSGGLQFWAGWLGSNDDLTLAAAMGASQEYLDHAIARFG
jgi:hypothetical protein